MSGAPRNPRTAAASCAGGTGRRKDARADADAAGRGRDVGPVVPIRRRGSALILCLLVTTLLLIVGMAFLGKRATQYGAARATSAQAQARWLAESGLQDALIKLQRDGQFPPNASEDQVLYSYFEQVDDLSGNPIGYYLVELDSSYLTRPYYLMRIRSTGVAGRLDKPSSTRSVEVELDLDPVSPTFFKVVNRSDGGAP